MSQTDFDNRTISWSVTVKCRTQYMVILFHVFLMHYMYWHTANALGVCV